MDIQNKTFENIEPVIDESLDTELKEEVERYTYTITFINGKPTLTKNLK